MLNCWAPLESHFCAKDRNQDVYMKKRSCENTQEGCHLEGASRETNPTGTLTLDFYPPELRYSSNEFPDDLSWQHRVLDGGIQIRNLLR
uniref:Uncharacterized protein n=1 Tax=Mustela putorius furo TaxID=9669 RepID=M3XRD6_MUSPF